MQETQSDSSPARRDLAALMTKLMNGQPYVVVTVYPIPLQASVDIDAIKAGEFSAVAIKDTFTLSSSKVSWPVCRLDSVVPSKRELRFTVRVPGRRETLLRVFKCLGAGSQKQWEELEDAWLRLRQ